MVYTLRVRKLYSLNEEVVKEFENEVPEFYRSRVLDVLMIKFLIEGVGENSINNLLGDDESPSILTTSPSSTKEIL